jgi:hypothetical protein
MSFLGIDVHQIHDTGLAYVFLHCGPQVEIGLQSTDGKKDPVSLPTQGDTSATTVATN